MFEVLCQEKGGAIWRTIRLLPHTVAAMLDTVEKIQQVPNFLDKESPYAIFTDQSNTFFLVDEVGLIAVLPFKETALECHITFWDRRLRGRERLCRNLAEFIAATTKKILFTAIPEDRTALIAFARRVGFEEGYRNNGAVLMNFTNYTG